jgi:hypothetical protein
MFSLLKCLQLAVVQVEAGIITLAVEAQVVLSMTKITLLLLVLFMIFRSVLVVLRDHTMVVR